MFFCDLTHATDNNSMFLKIAKLQKKTLLTCLLRHSTCHRWGFENLRKNPKKYLIDLGLSATGKKKRTDGPAHFVETLIYFHLRFALLSLFNFPYHQVG